MDDPVVQLLEKEAKLKRAQYLAHGCSSLLEEQPPTKAKLVPNKRFLANVVKQTNSHNKALDQKSGGKGRSNEKPHTQTFKRADSNNTNGRNEKMECSEKMDRNDRMALSERNEVHKRKRQRHVEESVISATTLDRNRRRR